jgi:S-adenosylmethionine-diacylglycerol 3-amino-3-carboxypropyl transferase
MAAQVKSKLSMLNKEHLHNVDFELIRYANCWEDPELLLSAFDIDSDSQIVSIASGGDNCFSLVSKSPGMVIAVDVSRVQLFLVELKKISIQHFTREEYLSFAGFVDAENRLDYYDRIKDKLNIEARTYWDDRRIEIREGIIHIGKFERYFQLFRKTFLLKIHDQSTIDGLFKPKTAKEQLAFYEEHWFDSRWEVMHKKFFGKEMLGEKGRDPEFMKQVKESVSQSILKKEVAHLKSTNCQGNPFLFYILNNRFDEEHLPHYVRKENYDQVKANINKVVWEEGLLHHVLLKYDKSSHFNLSNIFEYMDLNQLKIVGKNILNHAKPGAKLAYWNFMVHRSLHDVFSDNLTYEQKPSELLSERDNGYFYDRFELNRVKEC